MNRIKIIKRANTQSSLEQLEQLETEAKQVNPTVDKRRAVKVVTDWIDDWRASKPKDARRAFADLFNAPPSTIG